MSLGIHFSDVADLEPGVSFNEDFLINSLSTDSRNIDSGDTYLAICGENHDGHDYINDVISKGVSSVVISRDDINIDKPSLVVSDTVYTLGNIAKLYREKFSAKVIGITGSNGKTTVKGMVESICKVTRSVTATIANNNNTIGVPLTLLSASVDDDVVVVEMGTSEQGEISILSRIVEPDISIIINVSESHLDGIGDKDDVFVEKAEIIGQTKPAGTVVLNADDAYCEAALKMARPRHILLFGFAMNADIRGEYEATEDASRVKAYTPQGVITYELSVPGRHNVANSLAAIAIAQAASIEQSDIVKGLESFAGIGGRLKTSMLEAGVRLLDDSYNANPASSKSALDVLAACSGRKIFVYAGMAELGDKSKTLHQEIGEHASESGIDRIYIVGEVAKPTFDSFSGFKKYFDDQDMMCDALAEDVRSGDCVLVKGSRRYHMDTVVRFIEEGGR